MSKKMIPIVFVLLLFHGGLNGFALAKNPAPAGIDQAPVTGTPAPAVMTDIHDIKPALAAGFDSDLLIYLLAGLVTVGMAGALIHYLLRRRRKKSITVTPMLLPEETARHLLDGLSDFETLSGREFYFRLCAILRGYIKDRFNVNAPEMTTEEVLPWIEKIDIDGKLRHDVKKLLSAADPIKFAGLSAASDQMGQDFLFVKKFVTDTTPDASVSTEG